MISFFVTTPNPRPDFQSVAVFLWSEQHDFDSDGNCSYPGDRNWTELMIESRERENERIDITSVSATPLILEVQSERSQLAARVAYYLATVTDGSLSEIFGGEYVEPDAFREHLDNFNAESAFKRVAAYQSRRT